jgi:hypothetical protein
MLQYIASGFRLEEIAHGKARRSYHKRKCSFVARHSGATEGGACIPIAVFSCALSDLEVMEMMSNCKMESGGWFKCVSEAYISGHGLYGFVEGK